MCFDHTITNTHADFPLAGLISHSSYSRNRLPSLPAVRPFRGELFLGPYTTRQVGVQLRLGIHYLGTLVLYR